MLFPYLLWISLVAFVVPQTPRCTSDTSFSNKLNGEYKVPFEELQDFLIGDDHFSQRWAALFQTKEHIKMRDSFDNFTVLSNWNSDDNQVYRRSVSYKRHHEVAFIGDSVMDINEIQWYSTSALNSVGGDIKERHMVFKKISESVVPVAGKMKIEVFYCVISLPTSTLLSVDAKVAEIESGFFGEIAKDQALDGLTDHYKVIDFLLKQVEKNYRSQYKGLTVTKAVDVVDLPSKETTNSNSSLFMFLAAFVVFCLVIALSYFCYSRCCARPEHAALAVEDPEHDPSSVIRICKGQHNKNNAAVTFADFEPSK